MSALPVGRLRRPRRISAFSLVAATLGMATAALVLYPLVQMFVSFLFEDGRLDLSSFSKAWNQPGTVRMLINTLIVVVASTSLAVVIGSLFAWLNERTDARIGLLSDTLPIIPLMIPPLVGTIGWILLATPGPGFLNGILRWLAHLVGIHTGPTGPLNVYSWWGLIFLYVLYLVPQVYLMVAAGLRNLDGSLEEASRANGAGPLRTLVRVTLPAVRPSIGGGTLLALLIAMAMFSVPVLIGTGARIDVLTVRIVQLMTNQFPAQTNIAVVWGLLMMLTIGTVWLAQTRMIRSGRHATVGAGRSSTFTRVRLGRWKWAARALMVVYMLATSVAPLIAVLIVSLQPFWTPQIHWHLLGFGSYHTLLFEQTLTRSSFRNSLVLGVIGATIAMVLAAVSAHYVRRSRSRVLRHFVDATTKLPGAFSQVVIAVALIASFAGPPFRLSGSLAILLIAYLIFYMPQATISASSSMAQIDTSLSEASLTCGASEGRTFRKVVAPLMLPGLTAGWVFVFVLMAGDVTGSVMLATTSTPVVGYTMLDLFTSGTYPLVAAMGALISVVTSAIVLGALYGSRRADRRLQTSSRRRRLRRLEPAGPRRLRPTPLPNPTKGH
jgi:iron(III) transport system permease protein